MVKDGQYRDIFEKKRINIILDPQLATIVHY